MIVGSLIVGVHRVLVVTVGIVVGVVSVGRAFIVLVLFLFSVG